MIVALKADVWAEGVVLGMETVGRAPPAAGSARPAGRSRVRTWGRILF